MTDGFGTSLVTIRLVTIRFGHDQADHDQAVTMRRSRPGRSRPGASGPGGSSTWDSAGDPLSSGAAPHHARSIGRSAHPADGTGVAPEPHLQLTGDLVRH